MQCRFSLMKLLHMEYAHSLATSRMRCRWPDASAVLIAPKASAERYSSLNRGPLPVDRSPSDMDEGRKAEDLGRGIAMPIGSVLNAVIGRAVNYLAEATVNF